MEWRVMHGYRFLYRISENGDVQKYHEKTGEWKPVTQCLMNGRAVVQLYITKTDRRPIAVHRLMDTYFFNGYAQKNGLCIIHKNGAKFDCAKENLDFITRRESNLRSLKTARARRVVKIDKYGNEVDYYQSCKEAAEKNHLSTTSIYNRVHNKLRDPFALDGHNYQFIE